MDGVDRLTRRKSLKERLGLTGMGCCGTTWGSRPTTIEDDDEEGPQDQQIDVPHVGQSTPENESNPGCLGPIPAASGMNLAAALAAERHFRAAQESDGEFGPSPSISPMRHVRPNGNGPSELSAETAPGTPLRVSLMKLLSESDGGDVETESGVGSDSMCCVCMRRKKGTAFIPCGHTFCRVCSRELWLNRGSCPLCNRQIVEILDIF